MHSQTSDSWWTSIDKLMFWKAGSWTKYESREIDLKLRVHYDQLILTNDNKILETLNMNSKLKGIYKGDVLILIVYKNDEQVRKIKLQLRADSGYYFKKLGENFPVSCYDGKSSLNTSYHNIEDVFKNALEAKDISTPRLQPPSNYNDFVKLCLLDPTFPQVVQETRKIFESIFENCPSS